MPRTMLMLTYKVLSYESRKAVRCKEEKRGDTAQHRSQKGYQVDAPRSHRTFTCDMRTK